MRARRWDWDWIVVGGFVGAMIVVMILAGIHGARERARCTDNGGRWVRVNCHEVEDQICTTIDLGNGFSTTNCMPVTSTVCDTVCRGARPEAGQL
jgi:hypothetical protein